ncbi:molybdenum cofactor guanylyltransferase [soil metagenome]
MTPRADTARMESEIPISALVLAGGRSSRFGSDKMAAQLAGQPLLHHAIRAVVNVCDEVLVVAGPDGLTLPLPGGSRVPVRVITDAEPFAGPLVALLLAAREAQGARLLVVAGDMPRLVPDLLRRLLTWPDDWKGICLEEGGSVRPLPCGLDRAATLRAGGALIDEGHRSLRDLIGRLGVQTLPESQWRLLDPLALSLRDIDLLVDLTRESDRPGTS